jgi:branched-chain amino acid transport system substrate-binding protein
MRGKKIGRRGVLGGAALASFAGTGRAGAQPAVPVRIGILTDESGPYADSGGPGSIAAAQMAVQDFGAIVLGRPIQIVHGNTQNKPDVASTIAGTWYDTDHVDVIVDLPVTAIAAAVQQVARQRGRSVIITAAATSDFTSKTCAPTSVHFADDTHALTAGTARAVVETGGKKWFFVSVDHAFGRALEGETAKVVLAAGGSVLGAVRHPIGATDYASLLLQAQSSGAEVIGFADVGGDLINLIKQAHEFGLGGPGGARIATFLTYITDIHSLGLPVTQGLTFASSFYWDQNEASRAFAKKFAAVRAGAMPTKTQAQTYAGTLHFLKAMAQAGSDDPLAVNKAMRAMPVDYFGRPTSIRADGRALYDLTLYRVKAPSESKGPWDYYTALHEIAAAEAFLPINEAACGGGA